MMQSFNAAAVLGFHLRALFDVKSQYGPVALTKVVLEREIQNGRHTYQLGAKASDGK